MTNIAWKVGQTVEVESRTWAGINKPGGCAKITFVHLAADGKHIESLDVKYILSGGREKQIDPSIVAPFETLNRGGRKRRGREFLMEKQCEQQQNENATSNHHNNNKRSRKKGSPTKGKPPPKRKMAQKKKEKIVLAVNELLDSPCSKHDDIPLAQMDLRMASSSPPSTCVTPDQKDRKKQPKKQQNILLPRCKLAEATGEQDRELGVKIPRTSPTPSGSSVPAYVFAHESTVEVSPLPIDRSCKVQKTKTTEARRGLFGTTAKNLKQPNISGTDPPTTKKLKSTTTEKSLTAPPKPASSTTTSKARPKAMKNPSEKEIKAASQAAKQQLKAPPPTSTAKSEKQRETTTQKTAARPKSALAAPQKTTSKTVSGVEKPWKDVFDYEVKKAKEFMDELVGPRAQDIIASPGNTPAKQAQEPTVNSRYDDFLGIFSKMRFDDGTISEEEFRKIIHRQKMNTPFSAEEITQHINQLCREGKVMQSDGTLYFID